jgi:nucleoid-associated protein YgaU
LSLCTVLIFLTTSCSFSNANKEDVTSRPSDELEFEVDKITENVPSDVVVEEEKVVAATIPDSNSSEMATVKPEEMKIETIITEGKAQAMEAPVEPQFKDYKTETAVPEVSKVLGSESKYAVQKGDTLMMIAFKLYGDYRKWKDLKIWNKETLAGKVGPGLTLKYYAPEKPFEWKPNGLPYLVKSGDTLGIISNEKYGTPKKWKSIYENNKPLILKPNLIFAGFTLYYVPMRDVASDQR